MTIKLKDIEAAQARIAGVALHTPLVYSHTLSRVSGRRVFLKLENLQTTGSFKLRGALNRLKLLKERGEGDRVAAASAGNHGQGVAFAAAFLGLSATVVMPQGASISKQMACQGYGAQVLLHGLDLSESLEKALALTAEGYIFIHPYDDPEVIAGQGTLGLEILTDLPEVDTVVLPVGGGGLAAGTALALKSLKPRVRIIGVQTAQVPSLKAALDFGGPIAVPARPTLADGILVPKVGAHPFPLLKDYLSDVVLVEEREIVQALLWLLEGKKVLAEGAGAVTAAAFLGPLKDLDLGERVVLVVSGGNIDIPLLERVVPRALLERRRLLNLRVALSATAPAPWAASPASWARRGPTSCTCSTTVWPGNCPWITPGWKSTWRLAALTTATRCLRRLRTRVMKLRRNPEKTVFTFRFSVERVKKLGWLRRELENNTVFGFRFSVKKTRIISKLKLKFVALETELGIKGFRSSQGVPRTPNT